MFTAEARIGADKAPRYLAQLCKHFAHKVAVEWSATQGRVDFGTGTCVMNAGDDELRVTCVAPTADGLARVKHIIEDHITRFGWRESLAVRWTEGDPAAGA